MKRLFIPMICIMLCGTLKLQAQTVPQAAQAKDANAGVMKFETTTHDYGEVAEGPMAEYDFVFTNTGKKPIIISSAQGSCGCTTAKFNPDPVMPGKKGTIHVIYNTENRPGPISKIVTVISNAAEPTAILHIKGNVKKRGA
jgi:hypothetical protein